MSVIVYSEIVYPTYVRRRYQTTLTDNLGGVQVDVLGMFNVQPEDDGSEVEAQQLINLADQEIQDWIAQIEQGGDPAHVDMGGYFVHSEPLWNTWEVATDGAVVPFLQVFAPNQSDSLVDVSILWGRLTKAEGEAIAGKNNDVSSEVQIAINTKAVNDAYIPLIDANGDPR